jgi:hypothetical protein
VGEGVVPKNGTSEEERGDDDVEAQRSKGGIVSYRIGGTLCTPGSGEAGAKGKRKRKGTGRFGEIDERNGTGRLLYGLSRNCAWRRRRGRAATSKGKG